MLLFLFVEKMRTRIEGFSCLSFVLDAHGFFCGFSCFCYVYDFFYAYHWSESVFREYPDGWLRQWEWRIPLLHRLHCNPSQSWQGSFRLRLLLLPLHHGQALSQRHVCLRSHRTGRQMHTWDPIKTGRCASKICYQDCWQRRSSWLRLASVPSGRHNCCCLS